MAQTQVTGQDAAPVPVHTDSEGALKNIISGISSASTKHIDVQYHNSGDLHAKHIIHFSRVSTNENLADIMTKALGPDKHRQFTSGIGLRTGL